MAALPTIPAGAAWKQDTTTAYVPRVLMPDAGLRPGDIRRTLVALDLAGDGVIAGCRVVIPSHNATLDAASCPLLEGARIAIPPGTPGSMSLAVRWAMPKQPQTGDFGGAVPVDVGRWVRPFDDQVLRGLRSDAQGTVTARFTIGANGRLTDCQAVSTDGSDLLAKETCSELLDRATLVSARDTSGRARETRGSMEVFWCRSQSACDLAQRLSRKAHAAATTP